MLRFEVALLTQPGERFDLAGGRRDGTLALYAVAVPGVSGDFNEDGMVDAADYVTWRKTDGDNQEAYQTWVENFGEPAAGGAPTAAGGVPEPASALLAVAAASLIGLRRVRR